MLLCYIVAGDEIDIASRAEMPQIGKQLDHRVVADDRAVGAHRYGGRERRAPWQCTLHSGVWYRKEFGLGRYFYDFDAPWVDIDDKSRPKKPPALAPWMVPENWRTGVGKSGREFAGGDGNGWSFEPYRYVDCSEGQQRTFFRRTFIRNQ